MYLHVKIDDGVKYINKIVKMCLEIYLGKSTIFHKGTTVTCVFTLYHSY